MTEVCELAARGQEAKQQCLREVLVPFDRDQVTRLVLLDQQVAAAPAPRLLLQVVEQAQVGAEVALGDAHGGH